MTKYLWNGGSFGPPVGVDPSAKVRVWGKEEGDVEVLTASEIDWRHWNEIDPREQAFLKMFGVSEKQDVYAYEVIK